MYLRPILLAWIFLLSVKAFGFEEKVLSLESLLGKKCCLGWREWVSFPNRFPQRIIAKVDTGAKTSALHATKIKTFEKDSQEWVRFTVFPNRDSKDLAHEIEARVIETKNIRSSTGKLTVRPVVEMLISIGKEKWPIEVTLVDRGVMGYRMLLGRSAIESKFLVDSEKSYFYSEKQKTIKAKSKTASPPSQPWWAIFTQWDHMGFVRNIVQTLICLSLILCLRYLISRYLEGRFHSPAARNMFLVYSRNISILLILGAIMVIWSSEFKSLSVYLMAVSVAFVISMKESIQNLHGGLMLTSARPFKIGDLIEVKKTSGIVLETNFTTTKISEIPSHGLSVHATGRTVMLPNSIFLVNPVTNFRTPHKFCLLTLIFPVKNSEEGRFYEQKLKSLGEEILLSYKSEAADYLLKNKEVDAVDKEFLHPQIAFDFPGGGKIDIILSMVVPSPQKIAIEQKIKRAIFEALPLDSGKGKSGRKD